MKIYTKAGDSGNTGLIGNERVSKTDPRVEAYGCVDELNANIGLLSAKLGSNKKGNPLLAPIQAELFSIGSDLASVNGDRQQFQFAAEAPLKRLELEIDEMEKCLEPLTAFILPGGCVEAAQAHLCRTVCRRAERKVVQLSLKTQVNPGVLAYLNRLSDWFFVLARDLNAGANVADVKWKP